MNEHRRQTDYVDEAGIRLAPMPLEGADARRLPAVRQEIALIPKLEFPGSEDEPRVSTATDYQPKKVDVNKRWKRGRRAGNFFVGALMLIMSAVVFLPYILAAANEPASAVPFKLVPSEFNVIGNFVTAFRQTDALGWGSAAATEVWKTMVPDILLAFGLFFVTLNVVRSIVGMCGAIKPKRYVVGAVIYLLCVAAVFIAALVGAENVGIARIDFIGDFIKGWNTSEFFTLFVTAAANLIIALACTLVTPQRTGYAGENK